jgi:HPt (histidine-containing phosphotransfer) domain-containing protein
MMSKGADDIASGPGQSLPPVDRAHLSRFTLGDERLDREILALFLGQIPLTVESLRFAVTDKDWQVAAHTLKGSARSVGAFNVARLAVEAEKLGGIANREACLALIEKIEACAAEVDRYFEDSFPALAS